MQLMLIYLIGISTTQP